MSRIIAAMLSGCCFTGAALADDGNAADRFSKALKANKDPKSALSTAEVWEISSGKSGTEVAIRMDLKSLHSLEGSRSSYLIFSAPASKDSDTSRLGTLDGLADGFNLGIGTLVRRPLDQSFMIAAIGAKLGYRRFTHYEPGTLEKIESSRSPAELNAALGFKPELIGPDLMLIGHFAFARAYEVNKASTRCPAGAGGTIDCVTGTFAAPKPVYTRVFAAETRYSGDRVAAVLRLGMDQSTKKKEAYGAIYLIGPPASNDGKIRPLNAGINLRRVTGEKLSLGVFVGSSFDFYKVSN
jgi:hypothetical protein